MGGVCFLRKRILYVIPGSMNFLPSWTWINKIIGLCVRGNSKCLEFSIHIGISLPGPMNFPRLVMGTLSFSLTGQLDFPDLGSAWHLSMMSRILQIPKEPFSMASWTIWNDSFKFFVNALLYPWKGHGYLWLAKSTSEGIISKPGGLNSRDQLRSRSRFLDLSSSTFETCQDCPKCRDKIIFLSGLWNLK